MNPRIQPIREIEFAARVGFLTKRLWLEFFAHGIGKSWRNKKWRYLTTSRIFRTLGGDSNILLPNPGHPAVKALGPISRPPVLLQFDHDELVARCELLISAGLEVFTRLEAEAKRVEPKQSSLKHSDLVLVNGDFRIAIEIELTRKSLPRYRQALRSIKECDFDKVIYVVPTPIIRSAIERCDADATGLGARLGFASLREWRRNPLTATLDFEEGPTNLIGLFGDQGRAG